MKAFTKHRYGGPEVLQLKEVERPIVKDDEILVQVKANSVNPADWHILRGQPILARIAFGLFKPKNEILGADFAGIVEEVGGQVEGYEKGDYVYGETIDGGAFAEFLVVDPKQTAKFSHDCKMEEMAATPIAGLTALQCLTTHGNVQKGERVLVNGASGGVGHFTIQIAKALGAHVTGVCSSRNVDFVKGLGADEVIAYDKEDMHKHQGNYDLVIDTHGNLNFSDIKRMGKRGVVIGFTTMGHTIKLFFSSMLSKFQVVAFTAKAKSEDLQILAKMISAGEIKVHLDKTFNYRDIPKAIAYIERMRTRGKVAMVWV